MPKPTASIALKPWALKQTPKGFLIAPASPSWEPPQQWQGPFPSLKHATLAIANALAREARGRLKARAAREAGR